MHLCIWSTIPTWKMNNPWLKLMHEIKDRDYYFCRSDFMARSQTLPVDGPRSITISIINIEWIIKEILKRDFVQNQSL